jgi:stage IV sporulation protein FB
VDGGFLILIAAAIFFDAGGLFCVAIAAALVHELGHYLALRRCGCRIAGLKLGIAGFSMEYSGSLSYYDEILTAAAGPVAGLALAAAAAVAGGWLWLRVLRELAAVSALLSVFNLLPARPLDGGKILYALTALRFGERAAARTLCVSSCAMILLTLVAGVSVVLRGGNGIALLAAAAWLIAYCAAEFRRSVRFS